MRSPGIRPFYRSALPCWAHPEPRNESRMAAIQKSFGIKFRMRLGPISKGIQFTGDVLCVSTVLAQHAGIVHVRSLVLRIIF